MRKDKDNIPELTKAEEQVMQALWKIEKGVVHDIMKELPEKEPGKPYAYNTISTIVRILEKKKFVSYKAYGKTHEYYPLIAKQDYSRVYLNNFMSKYFSGSFEKMVSFFVKQNNMDLADFEELTKHIEKDLKNEK